MTKSIYELVRDQPDDIKDRFVREYDRLVAQLCVPYDDYAGRQKIAELVAKELLS